MNSPPSEGLPGLFAMLLPLPLAAQLRSGCRIFFACSFLFEFFPSGSGSSHAPPRSGSIPRMTIQKGCLGTFPGMELQVPLEEDGGSICWLPFVFCLCFSLRVCPCVTRQKLDFTLWKFSLPAACKTALVLSCFPVFKNKTRVGSGITKCR